MHASKSGEFEFRDNTNGLRVRIMSTSIVYTVKSVIYEGILDKVILFII